MEFAPPEIITKKLLFEDLLKKQKIVIDKINLQKIGQEWIFKVLTISPPDKKSSYFEGTPIIFEQSKKLSKR